MKEDWSQIYPPASGSGNEANGLTGSWRARKIGDQQVVQDSDVTLDVTTKGEVSGSTGVNRFSGSATIDGREIEFSPLALTRRAGPPAVMEQESLLTRSLSRTSQFALRRDGTLVLMDEQGNQLIEYSKR